MHCGWKPPKHVNVRPCVPCFDKPDPKHKITRACACRATLGAAMAATAMDGAFADIVFDGGALLPCLRLTLEWSCSGGGGPRVELPCPASSAEGRLSPREGDRARNETTRRGSERSIPGPAVTELDGGSPPQRASSHDATLSKVKAEKESVAVAEQEQEAAPSWKRRRKILQVVGGGSPSKRTTVELKMCLLMNPSIIINPTVAVVLDYRHDFSDVLNNYLGAEGASGIVNDVNA